MTLACSLPAIVRRLLPSASVVLLPALVACVPMAAGTPAPLPSDVGSPSAPVAVATPSAASSPADAAYADALGDGCAHLGEAEAIRVSAGSGREGATAVPVGHERLVVGLPPSGEGWLRIAPTHEGQVFLFADVPATLSVRSVETDRESVPAAFPASASAACPGLRTAVRFPWTLEDGIMAVRILASVATLSLVVFDETPEAAGS